MCVSCGSSIDRTVDRRQIRRCLRETTRPPADSDADSRAEGPAMCTFYLLPSRAEVASRFASYLQTWFPGVRPSIDELADRLADTVSDASNAVVVFADELPPVRGV